ncbi:MAG: glycosyltransferase [Alicyclobacillaceae bacterium]|nr:glycosyltransferase [Alicyclobacillaceae bacterium]
MSFEISLCMIVRDEEKYLGRCLASAALYVSEIIIVDTGSTDRTRDIAASFGAHILEFPWKGDFSEARNAGLARAGMPWILVLDADEVLDPPDPAYLRKLLADPEADGYFVRIRHRIGDGSSEEWVIDSACRLFRNDPGIRFRGMIHEEVASAIRARPGGKVKFSELLLLHDGYLDAVISEKKKAERNMDILRRALQQNPNDPILLYAWGTEFFQQRAYPQALAAFERALALAPVFSGYTSDLVLKTAYALRETGRREEAVSLLRQAAAFYPDFVDLFELQAVLHLDEDRADLALPVVQRCVEMGPCKGTYTSSSGAGTYRAHYLAGVCCERLWLWEQALDHYRQALEHHPGYEIAWRRFLELAFLLERQEESADLLRRLRREVREPLPSRLAAYARSRWTAAWRATLRNLLEVPDADAPADRDPRTVLAAPSATRAPFRLPVDASLALLGAPQEVKERLAEWCESHLREPTYGETLLAGWLALETRQDAAATQWFALAGHMRPGRLAPRLGRYLAAGMTVRRYQPSLGPSLAEILPDASLHRRLLLAAVAEPPL